MNDNTLDLYNKLCKIKKILLTNCEEICGRKYNDCNDTSCITKDAINIIDNKE